jgi:hypothetical protein
MPPRLSKRQQRELDELASLGQSSQQTRDLEESDEGEDAAVKLETSKPALGFAAVSAD